MNPSSSSSVRNHLPDSHPHRRLPRSLKLALEQEGTLEEQVACSGQDDSDHPPAPNSSAERWCFRDRWRQELRAEAMLALCIWRETGG